MFKTESSASSLMTSTTSSIVILPSNIPSRSTTAAEIKSAVSNILATSCWFKSGSITLASLIIISDMSVPVFATNKS